MDALTSLRATTEQFAVDGMTCGSCAARVEAALRTAPGVHHVEVDRGRGRATVRRDPAVGTLAALQAAVAAAGYRLRAAPAAPRGRQLLPRPVVFGLLAALGLVAVYLGLITLAQGWGHAVQQLSEDRFFVGAVMTGFGTQIGLFTYLRQLHARAAAGGVATSAGTSTAAMLACCAHHLAEVLPILGLSGAAVFLNLYKTPLLWLGILMNLAGIVYLLRQIQQARQQACHTVDHEGVGSR